MCQDSSIKATSSENKERKKREVYKGKEGGEKLKRKEIEILTLFVYMWVCHIYISLLYIMFKILLKTIPRSRENASRNFGSLKFSNELRISNKSPQDSRDSDPSSLQIRNHTVSSFTPLTSSYIPPQVNLSTLSTSFLALSTFTTISSLSPVNLFHYRVPPSQTLTYPPLSLSPTRPSPCTLEILPSIPLSLSPHFLTHSRLSFLILLIASLGRQVRAGRRGSERG